MSTGRDASTGSRAPVLAGVLGTFLLVLAVVAGLVVAPHLGAAFGARSGAAASPSGGAPDPEVQDLLDRRAAALLHHDAAAYLATQTTGADVPDAARIGALPWARYRYTEQGSTPSGPGTLLVTAVLVSQLVDDTSAATHTETLTLRSVDGGWRVQSEDLVAGGVQLWDLGALTTYQGRHVLVVGVDLPAAQLRRYAEAADAAVPGVDAVWGTGWPRHAVVVVPASATTLARGVGTSMDSLTDIAAFAIDDPGDAHGPLRVWVNAASLGSLSDVGREVILRHELAHVASRAPGSTTTPTWLAEGFAEFVGYRGSGIPLEVEVEDLLQAARRGQALQAMPTTDQLRDPATIAVAYESAALACTLVADRVGVAGLVRLYRLTAAGHGTPDANVAAALKTVTGLGVPAFQSAWRADVAALAA